MEVVAKIPVVGELDASGQEIVIVPMATNDWDIDEIDSLLAFITPAHRRMKEARVHGQPSPWLVHLSWEAVIQVRNSFPDTGKFRWVTGPRLSKWVFEEIMRRSCQGDLKGDVPVREPMPHQSAGAVAIGMNGKFLLADEPGAGKTAAILQGLAELQPRHRSPWPAMVVCPASVVDPWLEEIAAVYPSWHGIPYRGKNRDRFLYTDARSRDRLLLIMSYETMRNDMGDAGSKSVLEKWKPGTVVFDEAHKLCNHKTKQSVRARRIARHVPNVICATGTPITKNVGNFWPILHAMYPDAYPSEERYKERYTLDKGANKPEYGAKPGGLDPLREPEFRDVMRGTMRRVAKADVMKDLPPKTYQTRWVDIPAKWRAAYDEMERDMLAHIPDAEHQSPMEAMSTLAKMTRLRQLANSACDVEVRQLKETDEITGQPKTEMIVTPRMPCWKADALIEILEELHQDDEGSRINHGRRPVIAFAPFKTIVLLAGRLAEEKGYRVGYIVGGMTDNQRTAARLTFQDNQLDLICVSTGAGGTGLTLTAADTVVFLARPWSYVEATQAEDRAHRRGQTKSVMIIDLVARDSVESRVRSALKDKAKNLAELVQDRRLVEEFLGGA